MKEEKNLEKEKKLEDLIAMHELLLKYAPSAALLDIIERRDEYIVLYRDKNNSCTPYVIHHLNDNGLYFGHYYENRYTAGEDFAAMR